MANTIVAGNTASSSPDILGSANGGHNLIGGTPRLGTLGNNGGATQTIPLLSGSPAIGAGDIAVCTATGTGMVSGIDQRGRPRRTDRCSIGAYEAEPAVPNALPGTQPGAGAGSPSALPNTRPAGPAGGPAPNPLPNPRP